MSPATPPLLFPSPAQPQNHAEAQEVTLSLDPVPVARCVSSGGRPPARVSWISSLDGEAKEIQVPGTLPGTVTVTSRLTLVPLGRTDGVKVSCRVEHESFSEPVLLPVTLSVRCKYPQPPSRMMQATPGVPVYPHLLPCTPPSPCLPLEQHLHTSTPMSAELGWAVGSQPCALLPRHPSAGVLNCPSREARQTRRIQSFLLPEVS